MASRADESQRYLGAMERLVVVVQELSLARSVAAIQDIVRHAARELTGADGATFVLRDGDRCYYADEDAIDPLWKGQRFPMRTCISGWAMLNRQAAVIEDIYADDRIPHAAYRPTFVKSLAMVPIRTHDPIGAIGIYWARRYRPSEAEINLIQALADTTAVAMENVAVHDELEQRVRARTAEAEAARADAERADLLKSRLLAAANHDLRQPLQSLGLYLTALSRQVEATEPRELCDRARASIGTMEELIDTLLDLRRLESGEIKPAQHDFPIRDLLARIVADNGAQARRKNLTLELHCGACMVHSDPALLRRVIENLVGNAIRYTHRGGVTIDCTAGDRHARISVRDTGIGIPSDAQARIFDEYVQLQDPDSEREGLGLGLSIARQLLQALDHRLELVSAPDAGSTFSIDVPLAGATDAPSARAMISRRSDSAHGPTVLVVDDDPAIADATALLLRSAGVQAHHAGDYESARALLLDGIRPDLIISDHHLPGGGMQTIRGLRETLGADVPAVLFTGDASVQAEDLSALHACTLLYKPVDGDRLLAVVAENTSHASAP